jgi:hypothetical protein
LSREYRNALKVKNACFRRYYSISSSNQNMVSVKG